MKNRLLALSVAFSLVACGGDGGSGSSPSPSPTPAPTPAPTPPAPSPGPSACAGSPVVTNATTYLGVVPTGDVGQWQFDTANLSSSYNVAGSFDHPALTADTATCSYTTLNSGSLHTAFLSNGLALSTASVGGITYPAVLVASPESSLANIAGTYDVLRWTREVLNTIGTTTTDYATFNVDSSGNWALCPDAAYSSTCGGPSGTLTANSAGGFDIVLGGQTVGRLLAKVSGASKVFTAAISNTANPSDTIVGMWVASSNASFVSGTNDGKYIVNGTDTTTSVITIAGLTGSAGTSTQTLVANSPVQGLFSIAGVAPNDIGLISSLGLFASVTPTNDQNVFLSVGVKALH